MKNIDVRQGILLKKSLGLSKYARTRPLLDSMMVSSISELYFKHKVLFLDQIKKNEMCNMTYIALSAYTETAPRISGSFFGQLIELRRVIGGEIDGVPSGDLIVTLADRFKSDKNELVEKIKNLFKNWSYNKQATEQLRKLLWVGGDSCDLMTIT